MYNRTFWKDHVVDEHGAVIQQGTNLSQDNFNKEELGIFEAQITQDVNAIINRLNADEAREATPCNLTAVSLNAGVNTVYFPDDKKRYTSNYSVMPVLDAAGTAVLAVTAKQVNGFTVNASASCTATFIVIGGLL